MIELDKSDIESIEGVKYTPGYYEDGPSQDEPSSDEKKPEATKQEGSSGQVPGQQGMEVKGLSPDQRKRLAQINEKKTVLKTEREKILQERDRLNEEIKNAGIIRKQEDVDEFRRRLAESEAKIREFNEEVRRLNDEESILFGESSAPKQP